LGYKKSISKQLLGYSSILKSQHNFTLKQDIFP
jgi:hypothetical protein